MKKLLNILFVSVFSLYGVFQGYSFEQKQIGSSDTIAILKNQLQNVKNDTARIRILYCLAKEYMVIKNTEAEQYAQQALQISHDLKSSENITTGYVMLGTIKLGLGEYVEAEKLLNEGLSHLTKTNKKEIATFYNSLGSLHLELGNYDKALEYFNKSTAIFTRLKKDDIVSIISLNIGIIYFKKGNIDEALKLFSQLIKYFKSKKNTQQLIPAYNDLAEVFYLKALPDSAEYYCRESLKLSENSGRIDKVIESYFLLGKIYNSEHQYKTSNKFLIKALVLADTLKSNQNIADISKCLSENYVLKGDSGKAFLFLALNNKYENDLRKQETSKNIAKRELDEQSRISETRTELFYISLACLLVSILLIIAIYHNFRIKQKANRLLTEMDELKSKLFSNITHEFRTPLTLILGPLEEMLAAGEKRNPTRHEIKMMKRNANRLLNLVNQMLDLAKLDANSLKIELSEADFVKFFRVRAASFASVADQKGINYTWSVPDDSLVTRFDTDKVEKIINNLLSNAFKYTDRGGEVKCVLEIINRSKEIVKFYVSDTGKGIPADQLQKIFDRFHQVEGMFGSESFSTGIGLSLTKELINLLHGEITVESDLGTGSRFTVTLPLGIKHLNNKEYIMVNMIKPESKKTPEKRDFSEEKEHYLPAASAEITSAEYIPVVLTVEDQKEIRDYIVEHLKDSYRILEAENGKEGLETAIKKLPDLIITDLIMPEMDGVELCRNLKTDERTSHIPVIILSARSGMGDRMEGIETGADVYLTKPFHTQELMLVVRKLIEQRKKLRERFSRDVKLEPKDIAITPADEKFLNRALSLIEKHIGDFEFEVNIFQEEMAMSRMQLFRKIKALTDQTPGEFIRTIRLKRAAKLIEQGFGNIAQVTFEVGFNNPSYFARCFKDLYGSLPSDYAKKFRPDSGKK